MHDAIFENQQSLSPELLLSLAQKLGLSDDELRDALESDKYQPRVREDFEGGVRSGVNGTPTFFINGRRYDGPFEYEDLVEAIGSQLAKTSR
jgi:protein-disulfide isomerase